MVRRALSGAAAWGGAGAGRLLLLGCLLLPGASAAAGAEMTAGQLDAAQRVYAGIIHCEFKERIVLNPLPDRPGHFALRFQNTAHVLVVQETTTGAVRLEDSASGWVWVQIPAKSMLMNHKRGQRLADACLHAKQPQVATTLVSGLPLLLDEAPPAEAGLWLPLAPQPAVWPSVGPSAGR